MSTKSSILDTDGYKFSMAQAGAPLRPETFYNSFRRGGWHYNPYNLEEKVQGLLPSDVSDDEYAYLADNNYRLTEAMRQAIRGDLKVLSVPQGAWFYNHEPILSATGPSFLASYPEAKITWLNYGIQLATYLKGPGHGGAPMPLEIISDEHEAIVDEVFSLVGIGHPTTRVDNYAARVHAVARDMVAALDGGDVAMRLIEGGMRSAICMDHHRMVLEACREVGITRTSNCLLARELGMVPSGTAGHEHSQRSGSDAVAYANYMDRVCGLVSCLSDTVSTLNSGLPATIAIALANEFRQFLFRLDSGDRMSYFHIAAVNFMQQQVENVIINIAGDVNAKMIRDFEPLRKMISWEADRLSYMIGGQLTCATLPTPLTRSRVASVYKLCRTGGRGTMKLGDDVGVGKRSAPGHPVTWRRLRGDGPVGIIGQLGEEVPDNYICLQDNPEASSRLNIARAAPVWNGTEFQWGGEPEVPNLSPETQRLVDLCVAEMKAA